jgi:hypothetical protein
MIHGMNTLRMQLHLTNLLFSQKNAILCQGQKYGLVKIGGDSLMDHFA